MPATTMPIFERERNKATFVWTSATWKVALLGTGYTWAATHEDLADVSANEISDGGYSRQNLVTPTLTMSGADVTISATSPVSFGPFTGAVTIKAAYVAYHSGLGDSNDWLVTYHEFASPVACAAGQGFDMTIGSDGLAKSSAAVV